MKQRLVQEGDNWIECIVNEIDKNSKSWYFCIEGNPHNVKGIPNLILEDYNLFVTDNENNLVGMIVTEDKNNINKETIKTLSLPECHKRFDKFENVITFFNNIVKQIDF